MKFVSAAALALAPVALLATSSPAFADAHAEMPAGEKAAALTIDTPIEALMADEAAKAVVVKHLGPMDQHPAYGTFKSMSLVEVKPWSQGAITDEILEKIKTDLKALS